MFNFSKNLARAVSASALIGLVSAPIGAAAGNKLPADPAPFDGIIADNIVDSTAGSDSRPQAPAGAPNILLFMSDDTGFSMSSAFGGPVSTPNYEKLAGKGQRYNQFHTTGICSPSRAALLTGRNHHNAGVGYLSDLGGNYPGYTGKISRQTATIAQLLTLSGYSTAMFGKHHNIPANERSVSGPFDSWPTGIGFDYYYGFITGDTDQFQPAMYRGIQSVTGDGKPGDLVDKLLADDMIRWIHNQKASAPDKPFFAYLAPGSTHAPHQAPPKWIAHFKGQFDMGWDVVREETWRRQISMGIIPAETKLTPRPAEIPAWDSLTPNEKRFHARSMEVAAAQLAYQDEQLGKIINELERMGELPNTLIALVIGDNGASGEAGPTGTVNELRSIIDHDERPQFLIDSIDKLGGPEAQGSYSIGWAWAMNTPLRWVKQYASMLGGIRNGMILSWDGHVAHPGAICSEFGHVIDIAPTIMDALHMSLPDEVLGAKQKPFDGQSLLPSLQNCEPNRPRTQYFEIGGKRGLWQNGWFASNDDGRVSWKFSPPGGPKPVTKWALYNLNEDFSQSTDVSAKYPEKTSELAAIFDREAKANNVYPLDHRSGPARGRDMPRSTRKHFGFWGKEISLPPYGPPMLLGRSFTVKADLNLETSTANGVVLALGSYFGGWSLYLDNGRPSFVWAKSTDPTEIMRVQSKGRLPKGQTNLTMRFETQGRGAPAIITLRSGDKEMARLALPENSLRVAGNGETLDVGRDTGVPVTPYYAPNGPLQGDIPYLSIDFD